MSDINVENSDLVEINNYGYPTQSGQFSDAKFKHLQYPS